MSQHEPNSFLNQWPDAFHTSIKQCINYTLCLQAAAETEANWDGAGQEEGIQIWRVENTRDEDDNPKFGINPWPTSQYGKFYSGDSYIILQSRKLEDSEGLVYDIYFWIGKNSSQDEYGVAAYKSVELDDLLGDAPVQHREVQHRESSAFLNCFNGDIQYLKGGVESGFREVGDKENDVGISGDPRLFLVHRKDRKTMVIEVSIEQGMNHGDAFLLDCNDKIYTWFGTSSSPFEKNKAAQIAHDLAVARSGHAVVVRVEDDADADAAVFWETLGCTREDIKDTVDYEELFSDSSSDTQETKLYVLSDEDSFIRVEERPAERENLVSDDVCLIDTGKTIFVWIGTGSSLGEQSQAMLMAQKHINALGRSANTCVVRILEGQESRVDGFLGSF